MKHIKKFNEELAPETYLSAANKLRDKGHDKRANDLMNHAEPTDLGDIKKEFILYTSGGTPYNVKWENGKFTVVDSNRDVEIVDGLLYLNVPRMGNEKNPRLYTATRKEAIELNNLLKVIYPGHENVNINDVYRDIEVKPSYKDTMKDKVETAKERIDVKKPGLIKRFKDKWNEMDFTGGTSFGDVLKNTSKIG